MRKLSQLCQTLERIPGLANAPAFWREYCGPDFPLIEPHLRPTDDIGATYLCRHPTGGYCPRKTVDNGGGEYIAICRDPHRICDDEESSLTWIAADAVDSDGLPVDLADRHDRYLRRRAAVEATYFADTSFWIALSSRRFGTTPKPLLGTRPSCGPVAGL